MNLAATSTAHEPAFVSPLKVRLGWIAVVAFASGFPFGLVNEAVPIYLRTTGASLVDIGHLAKLSLPWSLKWLWAPLIDRHGSRRGWIVARHILVPEPATPGTGFSGGNP